jgi:NADPH:quinone reductase-like Zn-dependent oxidoreductase
MSTNTMKAIQIHDYGGPEMLKLEEVPIPQPGEGQVLIRMMAAGVNPADWKRRAGLFKQYLPLQFPWTPGMEGAGVIETVGAGVTRFKPGQAVFGLIMSPYAEYALAAAGDLQPKPSAMTFDQAASIAVGALTAWAAVVDTAQVQSGQRVLVHGAAGGVGLYAVQLARWKEAYVIGTASAANAGLARSLGVEQVIDYNSQPFENLVHDLDVVIDTVGGEIPNRSLQTLRQGGVLVSVAGRLSPELGKDRGVRTTSAGRAPSENLGQIAQVIEAGKIRPVVGKVFPLSEARQAHELSQTGHGSGRIILRIAS